MTRLVRLPRHALERILDLVLGMAVERRGGLVEHQDGRRFQNGAGDRHALFLAADSFKPRSPTSAS